MKRRESGKSARHARRDGWRAPSQAMLKYCRHKTTPKIAIENIRSTRTQDCAKRERSTTIRVPSSRSAGNTASGIPQDVRLGRRLCDRPVPQRMSFRTGCVSEDPARAVEPALFLGRKRLDGVAWGRVRPRNGGCRRRVTHGPPVLRGPVVAGGQGRLPQNQQSGERRRGP